MFLLELLINYFRSDWLNGLYSLFLVRAVTSAFFRSTSGDPSRG